MRRLVLFASCVITFVLCVVVLFSFAAPVSAQVQGRSTTPGRAHPYSSNTYEESIVNANQNSSANRDETASGVLSGSLWFLTKSAIGTEDPQAEQILGSSGVSIMGNAIASMIKQPPASGQVWLADLMQSSPFVPQAYAQGIGFKSLTPVLPIWKAFRDLAYVLFVIAFIIIGFLIMFRQKLGGQTAVTVVSALPNLIITLLLITFSYAIAGFVIDLMYLVIYLVIGLLKAQNLLPASLPQPGIAGESISLENIALTNNIFQNGLQMIFGGGANSPTANAAQAVGSIVQGFFSNAGEGVGEALVNIIGGGANVLAFLIFAIAVFFAVVKTFFQLLMSYVTFIISVIFSPLQLMIGAFTGKHDFWQWLKNLIATLAPFPVVITMLFLAMILAGQGETAGFRGDADFNSQGFQAPLIGLYGDTGAIAAVQGLIAIGILMLIPEAVKLSREWIGAKNPFEKYIADVGQNLKKGWTGGELVPGLKFTDTSKWAGGGFSGENIARKAAIGAAGAGGAFAGGGASVIQSVYQGRAPSRAQVFSDASRVGGSWMRGVGTTTHDPQVEAYEKAQKEKEKGTPGSPPPPTTAAV